MEAAEHELIRSSHLFQQWLPLSPLNILWFKCLKALTPCSSVLILTDITGPYKLKDFNIQVTCTHIFADFKTCLCNNVQQPAQYLHLEVKLFIADVAKTGSVFFSLMPTNTIEFTFIINDLFSHTSRMKIRSYLWCFLLSQSSDLFVSIPNQLDIGKSDIKFAFSWLSPSSIFLIACNLWMETQKSY